jgi:hypothetical protein
MFFLIDFIAAGTRCLLQVLVLAHDWICLLALFLLDPAIRTISLHLLIL